jgi:hypothetical protein
MGLKFGPEQVLATYGILHNQDLIVTILSSNN